MKPASLLRPLLRHVLLALSVAAVGLPLIWIGLAAFKTQIALLMGSTLFTPYWGNFDELLFSRSSDYLHNFANSLLIAATSTAIVLCDVPVRGLGRQPRFPDPRSRRAAPADRPGRDVTVRA